MEVQSIEPKIPSSGGSGGFKEIEIIKRPLVRWTSDSTHDFSGYGNLSR
jgi:hypothetical protein